MKTKSGKVRKRKSSLSKRRKLRAVLKMLAVMEPNPETSQDPVSEFLITGRTGRRNAMADILGPHATTSSGDLPERLRTLCTADSDSGPSVTTNQDQRGANIDNSCNVGAPVPGTSSSTGLSDQNQHTGNT